MRTTTIKPIGLVGLTLLGLFGVVACGNDHQRSQPAQQPTTGYQSQALSQQPPPGSSQPYGATVRPMTIAPNDPSLSAQGPMTSGAQPPLLDPSPRSATLEPPIEQVPSFDPAAKKFGGEAGKGDRVLAKTEQPLTNGEVIGVLITANDGEVQQADLAIKKAAGSKVKEFAGMMKQHHSQGLQKAKALETKAKIPSSNSELTSFLQSDNDMTIKDLRDKEGASFDVAYMSAQVKGHKAVLQAIDNRLIPSATNGELKTMLTETRRIVAEHLTKAEEINKRMDVTAGKAKGQGSSIAGQGLPQDRQPKDAAMSGGKHEDQAKTHDKAPADRH